MRVVPTLVFALFAAGCAAPQKWQLSTLLSASDAEVLLDTADPGELDSELIAREAPDIPMPAQLRPCCILGDNAQVRIGSVPVPLFRLPNVRGPDELGEHTFGSGVVRTVRSGRTEPGIDSENNGLVYTCRGGFIDTAHLREWADWTLYFTAAFARAAPEGTEIDFPRGSVPIKVKLKPIEQQVRSELGLRRLAVALAQWTTFHLSTWHEIETWYGAHSVPGWSEEPSAFSPEDMFSNMVGLRLAGGIIFHRGGSESEALYNEAVGRWMQGMMEHLEAVPKRLGQQAAKAVDGLWWNSDARLPDRDFILRRNFQFDRQQGWQVPPSIMRDITFAELRAACGDDPEPVTLVAIDALAGYELEDWVTIEFHLDEKLAAEEPFPKYGPTVTHRDLREIVEAIRLQNLQEFGEGSDKPF